MAKITAIHSGGDWADASAEYFVLPEGMDIEKEQQAWHDWYRNIYCISRECGQNKEKFITLSEMLIEHGARLTTDDELEIVDYT